MLDHAVVAKNGIRFALFLKWIHLPVLLPIRHVRLIICSIIVNNVSFIC